MTDRSPAEDPPPDHQSSAAPPADQSRDEDDVADAPVADSAVAEYTTDRRTLSPLVQLQWMVPVLVFGVVVTAGGWFGALRVGLDPRLAPAVAGVLALLGVVWVHLRFRIWNYRVRDDALYLERGVLRHVRTVAPHVRIQHVDTSRGPIERALGLSTLVVYTAGSRGADVSVPGLTPREAADLQTRVKELAIATEGGDAV